LKTLIIFLLFLLPFPALAGNFDMDLTSTSGIIDSQSLYFGIDTEIKKISLVSKLNYSEQNDLETEDKVLETEDKVLETENKALEIENKAFLRLGYNLTITLKYEGLYSNDPDDFGGETYKGISRNKHPNWPGWKIIDSYTLPLPFSDKVEKNLFHIVKKFYRLKFWDEIMGNKITSLEIAQELFDTAVNMGNHRAIKFLQQSLNLLNRTGVLFTDLVVDGIVGPKTLHALEIIIEARDTEILVLWMNVFQGMHYAKIMKKNPLQEKYARGWAKRIKIVKE